MDYEKKYKEALERARLSRLQLLDIGEEATEIEYIFPELKESENEKIRRALMKFIEKIPYERLENDGVSVKDALAWLEKQGSEPNWCHHKVDLSNCSEEYRKAYYDGWNNCNQQHSQCKSESNDVVKCLINGMKFYYEDNEEATWGTEKFSMKVKDILSWLEKQGEQKASYTTIVETGNGGINALVTRELPTNGCDEQKPAWSEEDETIISALSQLLKDCELENNWNCVYSNDREVFFVDIVNWLKSLRPQPKQEWSEEDQNALEDVREAVVHYWGGETQDILLYWLKSLKQRIGGKP